MALCPRCHVHVTRAHVCHHGNVWRAGDFFVGAVLGGAIGILLFGMLGYTLFGRALDAVGLAGGSLVGLTFVRATSRLQLR